MKFSEFKKNIDAGLKTSLIEEESTERTKNLEIILNIINSINRSLVLEDVLELVLKNAIRLTNSERGFIVLKSPTGKLEFKLGLDSNNKELPEELFQVSSSVVEDVFYNGQSRFIEGAQSDAMFVPSKSIVRLDLQTILCSPLITDGQKIGVIYVDSKRLHKIKEKDITNTFEILAGQAASAIRNAQLYNAQLNANKALQEANEQLVKAERKALKSSIDSEIGQSLQSLVHLALLEGESLYRMIDDIQKQFEKRPEFKDSIIFDRLKLKAKISTDSIRSIQKYAQVLLETSLMNLVKDTNDLNKTVQTVIKYLVPMKKFQLATFNTELTNIPPCSFDSEQIQHVLVHLITNSVNAKKDATITIKSFTSDGYNHIVIQDDGPGIPFEIKEDIVNNYTPRNNSYGLFLCKSIIEKHNGEIKFLDVEKGTAIQISLPLK
ncbi:Signal transduction histidine kinase [Ignavibacterium album JCM 16511]|uniref:histidine kinase n=1 Tax=Ignavibacterium album (strain DSM 19864 / JCM 16511 / NBRC 101810 / Mat9-16) TaxID=945713 RepID=I0AGJ5_IGNAJ|nr:ATP-binding protein [Ignavibacterium album]AFH48102.1 Signal transduction histidine kinase [Ignavibacterium album JCM 16511]